MKEILMQMKERLEKGEELVLVTVLASSGSTPRGAGAHMLVGRSGRIAGTIGGGMVEHRAEQMAGKALAEKASAVHEFVLNKEDVQNLGMVCGGEVCVFFRYLPAGDEHTLRTISQANEGFRAKENLWLLSGLQEGGRLGLYSPSLGLTDERMPRDIIPHLGRRPERFRENG